MYLSGTRRYSETALVNKLWTAMKNNARPRNCWKWCLRNSIPTVKRFAWDIIYRTQKRQTLTSSPVIALDPISMLLMLCKWIWQARFRIGRVGEAEEFDDTQGPVFAIFYLCQPPGSCWNHEDMAEPIARDSVWGSRLVKNGMVDKASVPPVVLE